jgi:hypothetical protein
MAGRTPTRGSGVVNADVEPIVGNWYKREDTEQTFTVIAVDEDEGIIEIQRVDGEIEELDEAAWANLELEVVDEPDEWRGMLGDSEDDIEDEDEDDDDWDDDSDDRR